MSCFKLLFCLDWCLCETLSTWECLSLHFTSFPPCSYSEKQCLVRYLSCICSSLVSNNYLVSNNCSAQNNFHSLVNLLLPIALLFRLMSVWNIIQLIMSIFTLHVISVVVSIQKSSALWDNCLVYSTSLISNNYLGSNKCSVDNNLHFSRECLVSICFSF